VWFGDDEANRAREANRHHAMGATGKGASEGIISKMRDRGDEQLARSRLFINHPRSSSFQFADTVRVLNAQLKSGHNVLLEGTQGALLDFNTGPYPFVTTRMTNAPAWLAEAGLPPENVETILVLRSYPIRVAGNSGPMPDEISWPILAREINGYRKGFEQPAMVPESAIQEFENCLTRVVRSDYPDVWTTLGDRATQFHLWSPEECQLFRVCLSEANATALKQMSEIGRANLAFFEKTTVTKKLRRIARFSYTEAKLAILMNAPTSIAYTFINYDMPELWSETNAKTVMFSAKDRLDQLQTLLGVPVDYVTTERYQENVINLRS
jgi:hypothetical protein